MDYTQKWQNCVWGEYIFEGTGKNKKYLKIFRLLGDKGKVVELTDCNKVDRIEKELRAKFKKNKFTNDPQIIAIITVSKCKIVCTNDGSSFEFIQNRSLYPKGISPPKIYTHRRNKNLLNNYNIAKICEPNVILTKRQLATLPS